MEKYGIEKEKKRNSDREKTAEMTCSHPQDKRLVDGDTEFCTECNKYLNTTRSN